MPPKWIFDADLAKLDALRELSRRSPNPNSRKLLACATIFLFTKAATLAVHHGLAGLVPDLAAAFPLFFKIL